MGRRKKIKVTTNEETPEVITETKSAEESTDFGNFDNDAPVIDPPAGNESESEEQNETVEEKDYSQDLADIDKLIAENTTESKRGRKSKEEKARAQIKIPGRLFTMVNDKVLTSGIAALDAWMTKDGNSIPAHWLALTKDQLDEMAPVGDLAVKALNLEEEPVTAFYVMLGGMYLSNFLQLKAMISQAKKQNPNFSIADFEPTETKK